MPNPAEHDAGARRHADGKRRCAWCTTEPLYVAYHDKEWGVAVRTDRELFEMLCLEGAQAGLSWLTILRKRESYRAAFDQFDAEKMARYGARKRKSLLLNPGIVRNRLKVDAFIDNAKAYLEICEQPGGFADYIWQFTDGKVLRRRPLYLSGIAQSTVHSDAMSKDLKQKGFRFVGSTICHAFMQAVGIVDEHQRHCWRAAAGTVITLTWLLAGTPNANAETAKPVLKANDLFDRPRCLSEQYFFRLFGHEGVVADGLRQLISANRGGARLDRLEPAFQMGKVG
jgi:DNA-3-methyladenine glycosylase I